MRSAALLSALFPVFFSVGVVAIASTSFASAQSITTSREGGFTEPNNPLSLASAIEFSLARNPHLAVAQREYESTEGALLQARVRPNPELAFAQEDTRAATRSSAFQLNLPIELGGKRAARIDASERGREVALAELTLRHGEVRASVIAAYFDVLTAQERVRLAQSTLDTVKRATDATSKRVQAGKISPVDEVKAKVAEANVRIELSQAHSDLRLARQKLSALWGNTNPRFERADDAVDKLPEVPSQATLEQRLSQAPAIQRAEFEVRRKQALKDLEQAKRTPNPTVSLGVKRAADQHNQLLFGVSIPLPVFDNNQGNLLEALRREEKARDELVALQLRLQTDLQQARERLIASRSEVEAFSSEVLPGAQSAFSAATQGFEAGKFSYLETLDAQRTLVQAKTQYLRALGQTHRAAAEIERLLSDAVPQITKN